jgi:protocatechuate 3,4-dioxygenase beta subunit
MEKSRVGDGLGNLLAALFTVLALLAWYGYSEAGGCTPTPFDEIGPFYRPNAPVRSRIGSGYTLHGVILDAENCKPIPGARIEFWQAGPDGRYGDDWRATVFSDQSGRYRLETAFPPPYARRPPHIHILVDVKGYAGLITQHYPGSGKRTARLDLVLRRE